MSALALTQAQQGLWFAQALDPTSPAFVTADVVELPPGVDAAVLATAVRAALSEAEGLHVSITAIGGVPCQTRTSDPAVEVPVIEMADAEAAETWMRADVAAPFDLEEPSLCRQAVLRVAGAGVWWYQAIHHLATDAYASSLLQRRVADHFASAPGPSPFVGLDTLLDLDAAYVDSAAAAADLAHWRARLSAVAGEGAPSLAERGAAPSASPIRVERPLAAMPDGETALALVATWLHRTARVEAVVLGVPWMGRLGSPSARVPACWVNVVPLPLTVTPERTLAEVRTAAKAALADARRHGRLRAERLRRELGLLDVERRLVGPLVNLKPFGRTLSIGGHTAPIRTLSAGPVEDLSLTIEAGRLALEANPARYAPDEVIEHLRRLHGLLERGATLDPATPTGRIPVIDEDDRRAELTAARGPVVAVPEATLWSAFAAQAARTPELEAVRMAGGDARLTYAELHARAEALAAGLARAGAAPGEVVGIALDRCVELMVALLATLRTGAAYLPLEPDAPAERVASMREAAKPACVVGLVDGRLTVLDGTGEHPLALARTGPALGAGPTPDDDAYLLYTSGSTGRPKGVVVGHRAIVNRLHWMQARFGLGPGDRTLLKTPLGFDVSVWELFWPLLHGATQVIAQPGAHRDAEALEATLREERVGIVHFVPSMLATYLALPSADRLAALRHVVCSGEALGSELAERAHAVLGPIGLHNLYGPTEAAVDVTAWAREPGEAGPVPIGRPVANVSAYVLDAALEPCAQGVAGELHLAGVQLARGYRGRPDLTAQRFVADPFGAPGARMYATGDLVRRRRDGALEYLGRTDDQVKVRGVRVEPGEIEGALLRHPDVGRAAVVLREDVGQPARLVGYVVAATDPQLASAAGVGADPSTGAPALDGAALRAHLARQLPAAMVPAAVVVLDALPVGPTGKLDRRALPAPAAPTASSVGRPPDSPREAALCALFADVLGLDRVGPDDSFFDVGGHSLLAAALVARARATLGLQLSIGSVFAARTPAALAARTADGGADDALEPVLTLRPGTGPALWCVHPAGGLGWCYGPLAARLSGERPVVALQAEGLSGPAPADGEPLAALARRYVARLRAEQPEGPYHLLGWSVGGVIAHAMAAELEAQGAEVGLLALLDAYPGEQWRHLAPPSAGEARRALLTMAGLEAGAADCADDSADQCEAPSLPAVLRTLEREGSALASLGASTLAAVVAGVGRSARLLREAEHARTEGDALLFVAGAPREEAWLDPDGWASHVGGRVDTVELPCTHPGLVAPAMADAVAAQVSAAIGGGGLRPWVHRPRTEGTGGSGPSGPAPGEAGFRRGIARSA